MQDDNNGKSWWLSYQGVIAMLFIAFIGFYLLTEHKAHLFGALPWLILLACPFMHFFMHGHHHKGGHQGEQKKPNNPKGI